MELVCPAGSLPALKHGRSIAAPIACISVSGMPQMPAISPDSISMKKVWPKELPTHMTVAEKSCWH